MVLLYTGCSLQKERIKCIYMPIWKRKYPEKKGVAPQQFLNQWVVPGLLLILAASIAMNIFFGYKNLQLQKEILELKKNSPIQQSPNPTPDRQKVVCTEDVKLCPDGSYVGRDPKRNCEFVPCP
jgi:hypothetical protein